MARDALVRLRGVGRVYHAGGAAVEALRDVDLDVFEGELVALLGPSGSGKTTLMGVVGGLDRPDAGLVIVDGTDVAALRGEALAAYRLRAVGFVFQSPGLVPLMTAQENVALPLQLMGLAAKETDARAREALARVGLEARARHRSFELSGGEQQRVALARALAKEPRLLLADEPTGQLDSETSAAIVELIRSFRGRTTIVIATHDEAVAAMASRCVRIEDGRLLGGSIPPPNQ
jgi:putative ABC transport system ATP-binding protein